MIQYLKYNNLTMVMWTVVNIIKQTSKIDMMRLAVLTSLLQDDSMVDILTDGNISPTFANLRVTNRYGMSNMNKRFYHTLPLIVNTLNMLLDAGCVDLEEGVVGANERFGTFNPSAPGEMGSQTAGKVSEAIERLLAITTDVSTKRMVQLLNILV